MPPAYIKGYNFYQRKPPEPDMEEDLKRLKNFEQVKKHAEKEKQVINDTEQFENFMLKFGSYGKCYENAQLNQKLIKRAEQKQVEDSNSQKQDSRDAKFQLSNEEQEEYN